MTTYYYMRISTKEDRELQSYQRQKKALERYAEEIGVSMTQHNTYKDDVTGSTFDRKEWKELEERVKKEIKNDSVEIVFKDISRFSREAENGFNKYMELYNMGIKLTFLDNQTVSSDYIRNISDMNNNLSFTNKVALQSIVNILIAVELDRAEKQREYISKAITDGIMASDKKSGRKSGQLDKMTNELRVDIEKWLKDRGVKQIDLMKKHKISRNTLVKYIKEVQKEKGMQ